jgi:hypothetical protein
MPCTGYRRRPRFAPSVRSHHAYRFSSHTGRSARTVDLTSLEQGDDVRLLAVSQILLAIIDESDQAAARVSASSFPAELRSMISATERHLKLGMDGD